MANGDNVTTQISREAPFLEDYRRRLMDSVFAATDQPIVPQERAIAPFDEFQTAGFGEAARQLGFTFDPATGSLTRTGQAAFQPDLDAARAAAQAGIPALQAAQGQFDPSQSNYQQFFDQYQADVTNQALKQMDEEAAKAQANLATQAQRAGAFGGSRFGIAQSELARSAQDLRSRRIFEDMSRNFQQAQQAAQTANQQRQQAAQVFGQLGTQASRIGQDFAQLGQQQQAGTARDVQMQAGIGSLQRQINQAARDAGVANLLAQEQAPFDRISFASNVLAQQSPFVGSTQTLAPLSGQSPLLQAAGAVGGIATGLGQLIG